MKRSIIVPAIIVLISGTAVAQAPTPAITDSLDIPSSVSSPPASYPAITHSQPAVSQGVPTSGVEIGVPTTSSSSSYVGDLAPVESGSSYVSSGSQGEVISGDNTIGGAGCRERSYGQPDLFYNYFTQGYCNRANAQMYLSPQPVPPNVGHTFYTYQPFYPEEYLYWHTNRFHNYYDGGRGTNRTRAVYYGTPVRDTISNVYWNRLRIAR